MPPRQQPSESSTQTRRPHQGAPASGRSGGRGGGRGGGRSGGRLGTLRSGAASHATRGSSVASTSRIQITPPSSSDEEDEDDPQNAVYGFQDADDHEEETDSSHSSSSDGIHPTKKQTSSVILPTKENFHELGLEWGQAKADQVLAGMKLGKTPSPDGLFEGQALQAQYNLDKTMLCITLKCSRQALDEALLEGPLASEPNAYVNHLTYSKIATESAMPAKGVSEGFPARNKLVGHAWTSYNEEERMIFSPAMFERLVLASHEAFALTQNPASLPPLANTSETAASLTQSAALTPLTSDEVEQYIPIFNRLVNLKKVTADVKHGRLCRHSGRSSSNKLDKLMKGEINKVIRQLWILHTQFQLQFHVLLAAFNPGANTSKALFDAEHSSCQAWVDEKAKDHLRESFVVASVQPPAGIKGKKSKGPTPSALKQEELRKELSKALNDLCGKHLPGGYQHRGDAHPKVPDMVAAMKAKSFRGGTIRLRIKRTTDSKVTDAMLQKGAKFGDVTPKGINDWLKDIASGKYDVVKQGDDAMEEDDD